MVLLIDNNKLRAFIFNNIDQEDIFAYYLGISREDVDYCLQSSGNKINNPLRDDRNPSLGFKYMLKGSAYKLYMKDFADSRYNGDCFYIVGLQIGKDCNNKSDFIFICYDIINKVYYKSEKLVFNKINTVKDVIKKLDFQTRPISNLDLKYWKQYGLEIEDLIEGYVYAVEEAYVEDKRIYKYSYKDLCYAYYLGIDNETNIYQLYFPLRDKKAKLKRFITNSKQQIQTLLDIKLNSDLLIITKSRKDVLLLKKLEKIILSDSRLEIHNLFLLKGNFKISYCSLSSESNRLSKETINKLKQVSHNIVFLTDFDREGRNCAYYHKRLYNTTSLHLTNGFMNTKDYKYKDITDYYKGEGLTKTIHLAQETLILLINKFNLYDKYKRE